MRFANTAFYDFNRKERRERKEEGVQKLSFSWSNFWAVWRPSIFADFKFVRTKVNKQTMLVFGVVLVVVLTVAAIVAVVGLHVWEKDVLEFLARYLGAASTGAHVADPAKSRHDGR